MSTFPPQRPQRPGSTPSEEASAIPTAKASIPSATPAPAASDSGALPTRPSLPVRPPMPGARNRQLDVADTYEASEAEQGVAFEDVLKKSYDRSYKYLEEDVVYYRTWLQEYLQEKDMEEEVGSARAERGQKYADMQKRLQSLVLRQLLSEATRRYENRDIDEDEKDDNYKIASLVVNEILGLGPLEPLWVEPGVTEIIVNGPSRVRIERNGKLVDVPGVKFRNRDHAMDVAQQILLPLGRTVDVRVPFANGRLPDGSRVHILHYAVAPNGPMITVRRFPEKPFSIRALLYPDAGRSASMSEEMGLELANLVSKGCSIVVAGGTGAGKTSLLNALSGAISRGESIITIEDNIEMQLHPDADRRALETRASRSDEAAAVTIRDLVREALRMRPDRIIVGEVRDSSAYDMLQAMTTGHDGSMTTVHANDAEGAVERMVGLVQQSGEADTTRAMSMIASGVDLIVVVDRFPEDGSRRVVEIAEVPPFITRGTGGSSDRLELRPIWEFEQTGLETDESGEEHVMGSWVKRNELSDSFVRRNRLDKKTTMTLQEALAVSDTSD